MADQLNATLRTVFGHESFRPMQEDICRAMMDGRDVLAVLATSSGKSLTFMLPAYLSDGLTIVISPLISLMQDQVRHAKGFHIAAACLTSTQPRDEMIATYKAIAAGKLKLLYVAPERFFVKSFCNLIAKIKISRIVWDEIHALLEYSLGNFRPKYLECAKLISGTIKAPIAAFTATLTPMGRKDVAEILQLKNPATFISSFDRPNLFYEVRKKDGNGIKQIVDFIKSEGDNQGIIYRTTRMQTIETCLILQHAGINCLPYNAGMNLEKRYNYPTMFMNGSVQVMAATIAFGLGVDKPNVRWIIHADIPRSLEGYSQECGRACRDGKPGHCLFLYAPTDYPLAKSYVSKILDKEARAKAQKMLDAVREYARSTDCRRKQILEYFGERLEKHCGRCDNCVRVMCQGLKPKEVEKIQERAKRIIFHMPPPSIKGVAYVSV